MMRIQGEGYIECRLMRFQMSAMWSSWVLFSGISKKIHRSKSWLGLWNVRNVTGAAICQKLIGCLEGLNLNPDMCRAQTYDRAGNMAGEINGCAANFKKEHPQANYYHCASHNLNLALCKASQVPEIQNMMGSLQAVGHFFEYSPKQQQQLT